MAVDLRLPNITGTTPQERQSQMESYMRQFVEQLQWALNNIDMVQANGTYNVASNATTGQTPAQAPSKPVDALSTFATLKPLIIKSADIVNAYYEKMQTKFEGDFVAVSDFGAFQEHNTQVIDTNSQETTRKFTSIQEIEAGLAADIQAVGGEVGKLETDIISYKDDVDNSLQDVRESLDKINYSLVEVSANLKSGILYYNDAGIPVYGLEVGQRTKVDGVEVFNKFARFTADKLSFYDQNEREVAYISDRKLYITHVEVTGTFRMGGFEETVQADGSIVKKWADRGGEGVWRYTKAYR